MQHCQDNLIYSGGVRWIVGSILNAWAQGVASRKFSEESLDNEGVKSEREENGSQILDTVP